MTRFIATGLEHGRKRVLTWLDGELTGDADLQERFRRAWDAADLKAFRKKLRQAALAWADLWNTEPLTPARRRELSRIPRSRLREQLAEDILRSLFAETLDFERATLRTKTKLREWARAWNGHASKAGEARRYTLEDMRQLDEERAWNDHHGPPYHWEEIAAVLKRRRLPVKAAGEPPEHRPKCLECLQPMEWIWFCSHPETWQLLCGRAGWTPICRPCHTWRACRVGILN